MHWILYQHAGCIDLVFKMFPIHPLPGAMAENLEEERAFFLHMQKAEPCVSNLKCVFLDYCEEVEPRMSPTQRLEPEKSQ